MNVVKRVKEYITEKYEANEYFDILGKNSLLLILKSQFSEFFLRDELEQIQALANRNYIKSIDRELQLKAIKKKFEDLGIEFIVFKGLILEKELYDNKYERMVGDIDIYVKPEFFESALNALFEMDFKLRYEQGLQNEHHIQLIKSGRKLELHRNILAPRFKIDEGYLLSNIVEVEYNNNRYRTFNVNATLLHLLYHLYMDEMLYHSEIHNELSFFEVIKTSEETSRFLYRAFEIAKFIECHKNAISWKELYIDIKGQQLTKMFTEIVKKITNIFPEAFPNFFLEKICSEELMEYDSINAEFKEFLCKQEQKNLNKMKAAYVMESPKQFLVYDRKYSLSESDINIMNPYGTYLIQGEKPKNKYISSCEFIFRQTKDDIICQAKVLDSKPVYVDIDNPSTQMFDNLVLFFVNPCEYTYKMITVFFHLCENGSVEGLLYDNYNNCWLGKENVRVRATKDGFNVEVMVKKKWLNLKENNVLVNIHLANCSEKNSAKTSTLSLMGKGENWYDPREFALLKKKEELIDYV